MCPALLIYLSMAFYFFHLADLAPAARLCRASQTRSLMFLVILENLDHYLLKYYFYPILSLLSFWNSTDMTASLFYNVPWDFIAPGHCPHGSVWILLVDLS